MTLGFGQGASASAWNRLAGEGFASFDVTLDGGADYFDGRGHLAPARSYTKGEMAGYVEYGATDSVTLIARPSLDAIRIGGPDAAHYTGLGSTSVGAQLHLLNLGPAVLAVQGDVGLPGSTSRHDPALIGDTDREGEIRLLGGVTFGLGHYTGFVDAEQSYRIRSSGAAAEWHTEVTLGFRPFERILILLQSMSVVPTGSGSPWLPSATYSRLALSGVYDLTTKLSVKIGAYTTVFGRRALRERGVLTGLWYRF